MTLFNVRLVFIAFVFVFDFFFPLPIIFPIRSAASGANAAAIWKNPPFCVLPFPNINLLFLKCGFLNFFHAATLFGLFILYSLQFIMNSLLESKYKYWP